MNTVLSTTTIVLLLDYNFTLKVTPTATHYNIPPPAPKKPKQTKITTKPNNLWYGKPKVQKLKKVEQKIQIFFLRPYNGNSGLNMSPKVPVTYTHKLDHTNEHQLLFHPVKSYLSIQTKNKTKKKTSLIDFKSKFDRKFR